MSELDHDRVARLVDAYYAGELEHEQTAQMRQHLQDCEPCRALYDRRAAAESTAIGDENASSVADLRVMQGVLADPSLRAQRPQEKRWWALFVLAPVAAVAAALVFTLSLPPSESQLVARGAASQPGALGIGVAAVDPATGHVYDARQPEGVSLQHRLRFSYSDYRAQDGYLFLFGVDDALQPYWYFPLPEEGQSISVKGGAQQQLLPYETELARRHRAGRLRIVALFSAAPIAMTDVATVLQTLRAQPRALREAQWPGSPVVDVQQVVLTETAP